MRINIVSLGCRLNRSEMESVVSELRDRGHEITREIDADVFIINSCAVTLRSERKTRQLLNRALRGPGPGSAPRRIIVAGCAAGGLLKDGNVYHVPNSHKYLIPELIGDWGVFDRMQDRPDSRFSLAPPVRSSTCRVNLKIQDGCDNFCSYCIVPLVRGAPRSKPLSQVREEFSRLIDAGYKEILFTGVMIGQYQSDGAGLADLAEELLSFGGRFRIHLSSLTPIYLDERLMDVLGHEKMVRHLHLSLQSGSDKILERMNRSYTAGRYISLAGSIKKKIPDFNLTTDIIVGFPGETGADFDGTLSLIREVGFSHVHTFRYSPRPGTAAARMADTVPEPVKTERSKKVIAVSEELKREYYSRFNGRDSILLSERTKKGVTSGFNEYYVPVEVKEKLARNEFFTVTTALENGRLRLAGTVKPG
jgi:threonylcarbamoyladenosine tRNA methylthiotransferase MtaB